MNFLNKASVFLFLVCGVLACDPDIDFEKLNNDFEISNADLNFENYVAVGDEFTAGYHSNDLFFSGQISSYSFLLARQFQLFNDAPFVFPSMYDEKGLGNRLKLGFKSDCNNEEELTIIPYGTDYDRRNEQALVKTDYNNYGVPGLTVNDLDDQDFETENPYWARMYNPDHSNVLDQICGSEMSFFTVWLGLNDALRWARQGGNIISSSLPLPTVDFVFRQKYNELVDSLVSKTSTGVLATIPDIQNFPFFNLIPRNALVLNADQAAQLNFLYSANPFVSFQEGENNFVVREGAISRHIREDERILLNVDLDSVKCGGYGSLIPFDNATVLLEDEISELENIIRQYNFTIRRTAERLNLPLLDLNEFFQNIENSGINWDGVTTSYDFGTGGFFSVDGIYPTSRGSAFICNAFIEEINSFYGASIPLVNPNDFEGVVLP